MGFFRFLLNVFSASISFICTSTINVISELFFAPQQSEFLDHNRNTYIHRNTQKYNPEYRVFNHETRCRPRPNIIFRPSVALERKTLEMARLDEFPMPVNILAIQRNDKHSLSSDATEWISRKSEFRLSEDLYIRAYKMMAFFEEAAETITTDAYNLGDITLKHIDEDNSKGFYFNVAPDESKELFAAIDDKQLNQFTLERQTSGIDGCKLDGKIKGRKSDAIFVELFTKKLQSVVNYDGGYGVHFKVNRMNYQLQHNALMLISKHKLFPILINNPLYHNQHLHSEQCDLSITNQQELNAEQMQAIECMVSGNYSPVPNLLYGPPGTGKTKTIVAAIEKIVRTTKKNILVCAQSNAACDEIAERLAMVLTRKEMLRMFSKSHELGEIGSTVKPYSNLFDGELEYPSLDHLYSFRVLICTLSTAGCLVRARISAHFNPRHFGYVFIDECASAHETMALVPIAGLCTSVGKVHANIVLIGDPKQLDAVTKSDWSTELGFKTSWFEQLLNSALYKRHPTTGQFNPTYITQLVQNYRSHPAILKVPNQLFYENMLKAVATPDLVRMEVNGLLSRTFPIIFKSVHGYCKRDDNSTSSYNMEEVNAVIGFIEELLTTPKYQISQSDIGVVSPYKLQCKILHNRSAQKGYKSITIGSAEKFQGQERRVMIVSTVRSGGQLGDFLKNPQRFNVMITRAKSLLIIVGNPHLLSQDENWSTFIRYCFENRCLIQDNKYFRPKGN